MMVHDFVQGIVPPPTVLTLSDVLAANAPLDLTNAGEVRAYFYLSAPSGGKSLIQGWPRDCAIKPPATAGQATLTWTSIDVQAPGNYELQVVATFANGDEPSLIQQPITIRPNDALTSVPAALATAQGLIPSQFAPTGVPSEVLATSGASGTATWRTLSGADLASALAGEACATTFNADGSITQTYSPSGLVVTTTFGASTVTEVYGPPASVTKTTTFGVGAITEALA